MDKRSMFYGANPGTFKKAWKLRHEETDAEKLLWERLRKNQLNGFRFKRQHPILFFIADFYCHKAKLVVEIDGMYHQDEQQREYDRKRTEIMNELGLKVVRFANQEVINNLDGVVEQIRTFLLS